MYQQILKLLAQISILRRTLILKSAKSYLGTDFTPLDTTPDLVACAEAVTTLLKNCGCIDYIITGTWTLNNYLGNNKNWVVVKNPEPGDVAVAPTGMGNPNTIGHTWIVGEKNVWYSNDSYSGKWMANYTKQSAEYNYTVKKGIPIFYYRYLSVL